MTGWGFSGLRAGVSSPDIGIWTPSQVSFLAVVWVAAFPDNIQSKQGSEKA